MSTINLGDDFAAAVLSHAQMDEATDDPSTLVIDYLPAQGPATIRFTRVAQIDSAQLRQLIAETVGDGASVF